MKQSTSTSIVHPSLIMVVAGVKCSSDAGSAFFFPPWAQGVVGSNPIAPTKTPLSGFSCQSSGPRGSRIQFEKKVWARREVRAMRSRTQCQLDAKKGPASAPALCRNHGIENALPLPERVSDRGAVTKHARGRVFDVIVHEIEARLGAYKQAALDVELHAASELSHEVVAGGVRCTA
jgi:hypothetical protein